MRKIIVGLGLLIVCATMSGCNDEEYDTEYKNIRYHKYSTNENIAGVGQDMDRHYRSLENNAWTNMPTPTPSMSPTPTTTPEPKKKKEKVVMRVVKGRKYMYTKTCVNFRKKPTVKGKRIGYIPSLKKVRVLAKGSNGWYRVYSEGKTGYVYSDLLKRKIRKKSYSVRVPNTFKAWMPYTAITDTSSPQYKMQVSEAYTGEYGIRKVRGRYCVALGSYYGSEIGTEYDVVLKNGEVIPCILGDQKANKDTDSTHRYTTHDGSTIEFIVSSGSLHRKAKKSGNLSKANPDWMSSIERIVKLK